MAGVFGDVNMADNKYLKPMLDTGSTRVFNVNVMTQRLVAKDPAAIPFFRNKPLNTTLLIKDTAPESDYRKVGASVGTKLYFPFNVGNIYEGGRTIFLHEKQLEAAIVEQYGEGALAKDALEEDMRILGILNRLPSFDPFLMKDMFIRQKIDVNADYFTIAQEIWNEIEAFMLLKFEPLVKAAFPDAMSSDERARALINKIWEARDMVALRPLIEAFRLPSHEALDMFSSWRGIVYYTFQYEREKTNLIELIKWLKSHDGNMAGIPAPEVKEMKAMIVTVSDQMKAEWQVIEGIVRSYETAYDKMFKSKTSSAEFIAFLKNSSQTYWDIGNSIGKVSQGLYCWKAMTTRFANQKLPWPQLQEIMRILAKVFEAEKKSATASAW